MRRNGGFYICVCLAFLPSFWLAATASLETAGQLGTLVGAVTSGLIFCVLAGRSQAHGGLWAHRCLTCDHAMVRVKPGQMTPPIERFRERDPTWRCGNCGRLV